jgi:hypothetical protein
MEELEKRRSSKGFFSRPWVISISTSMLPMLVGYILPKICDSGIFQSLKRFFAKPFTIPMWLALSVGLMIISSLWRYIIFTRKDWNDVMKLF